MIEKAKIRGFEPVQLLVNPDWVVRIPEQATTHSAGYDFFAAEDVNIWGCNNKPTLVATGVKAYMRPDEVLVLANRSSNPKRGLMLANGIGVIDADYYNNPENDGHIMFAFWNFSNTDVTIKRGDKIGQGIFLNFLKADGGGTTAERRGGFGSTGI